MKYEAAGVICTTFWYMLVQPKKKGVIWVYRQHVRPVKMGSVA